MYHTFMLLYNKLHMYHTTINEKNMHPHRDLNLGPWNTIPML